MQTVTNVMQKKERVPTKMSAAVCVCVCVCESVCERECSTVDIIWDAFPILKPLTNKCDTMIK